MQGRTEKCSVLRFLNLLESRKLFGLNIIDFDLSSEYFLLVKESLFIECKTKSTYECKTKST